MTKAKSQKIIKNTKQLQEVNQPTAVANECVILANENDVLLVEDVQRILRIGRNKAYELVSSGRIKSIKIGTKRIIPKTCLIEFLKNTS